MNDIIELLNTIKENWALLAFFFTLGGAWWQGKAWFKKLDQALTTTGTHHEEQNRVLAEINGKIDLIEERITKLEETTSKIHDELHETEVKLAVIQNTQDINEGKALRSRSRRKTA